MQMIELVLCKSLVKTIHGTECNVFFVGISAWNSIKFSPSKSHQFAEIVIPDFLGGVSISFGKVQKPL
jgi:hypothetical protein